MTNPNPSTTHALTNVTNTTKQASRSLTVQLPNHRHTTATVNHENTQPPTHRAHPNCGNPNHNRTPFSQNNDDQ